MSAPGTSLKQALIEELRDYYEQFENIKEDALELSAITATLEVRVTNDRAQGLYRKYHFEVVGRRKHYYRDNGEDALLMTAELGSGYREDMRRLLAEKRPDRNGSGEPS